MLENKWEEEERRKKRKEEEGEEEEAAERREEEMHHRWGGAATDGHEPWALGIKTFIREKKWKENKTNVLIKKGARLDHPK